MLNEIKNELRNIYFLRHRLHKLVTDPRPSPNERYEMETIICEIGQRLTTIENLMQNL